MKHHWEVLRFTGFRPAQPKSEDDQEFLHELMTRVIVSGQFFGKRDDGRWFFSTVEVKIGEFGNKPYLLLDVVGNLCSEALDRINKHLEEGEK